MRFCLMVEGQEGPTWEHWLAVAGACERLGLEGLFTSDHYLSTGGAAGPGSNDAWTLLSGLAARTERLRLGTLVSPVTFRLPAHLAKAAVTVDRISSGRVEIGMGAGWNEPEHHTHGFPFPPAAERMEMLEEQLEIVHGLLTQDRVSFESRHYALEDCPFLPKGVQAPHPPIIVGGGGGPRSARLAATWADEFNTVGGTPDEVRRRFDRVRAAVDAAGRDHATFTTSFMTWVFVGATEDEWRARAGRARANEPGAKPFDEYLADLEIDCIVGTPDRAVARLAEYAAAGVQRIMLNHTLYDDLDMIELLASEILPKVPA